VAVALVDASSVDLRQPPQALGFELLHGAMQLSEVFLHARIGLIDQRFGAQSLDDRPELGHEGLTVLSNICSMVEDRPDRRL
jgi:hypothetical protein